MGVIHFENSFQFRHVGPCRSLAVNKAHAGKYAFAGLGRDTDERPFVVRFLVMDGLGGFKGSPDTGVCYLNF